MLIQPDKAYLGDKLLSPEEAVAAKREEIVRQRSSQKIPNQAILENHEAAQGQPMSPEDFIFRLRKAFPHIFVEQGGLPNAVSLKIAALDDDPDSETKGQMVKVGLSCGFYVDRPLPEYSSVVCDKWGVAKREIRGWRTVLLRLIHSKVITYDQAVKAFGEPQGPRSILWREQTVLHRT